MRGITRLATALALLAGLMVAAPRAWADAITVTRFDDPAPDGCDTDCSLREAILAAEADPGPDTILLRAGHYMLEIDETVIGEDAGLQGDLDIASEVAIEGAGAGKTIIDGDGIDRVFDVHSGANATLSSVTVTGGVPTVGIGSGLQNNGTLGLASVEIVGNGGLGANNAGAASNGGDLTISDSLISANKGRNTGGILNSFGGSLLVRDSVIRDNTAEEFHGGGVTNAVSTSEVTIIRSTISGNAAPEKGGGIYNTGGRVEVIDSVVIDNRVTEDGSEGGGIYNASELDVTDSSVTDNSTVDHGGGIRSIGAGAQTTIAGSLIARNRATDIEDSTGGGIATDEGTLTITGSVVRDNEVTGGGGGGISVEGSTVTLDSSLVSGNDVGSNGGGISNGNSGDVTITSTTISSNSGNSGGGIFNGATLGVSSSTISSNVASSNGGGLDQDFGPAEIADSTISGNTAAQDGGGINAEGGTLTIDASTITQNTADDDDTEDGQGGGLAAVGATTSMRASILAANDDATTLPFSHDDCTGTFTSLGFNVIGSDTVCTIDDQMASDTVGDIVTPVDPMIEPLHHNGGPTQTHALDPASPALDREVGATCGGADQRGAPRPAGAACDSGAYELATCGPNVVNVVGTNGPDVLSGTPGDDGILGLGGKDRLEGGAGDDALCGGGGNDKLIGGTGKDFLDGGPGRRDLCKGGPGRDTFKRCERTRA